MPMKIGDAIPALDGATTWFNGSLEETTKKFVTIVHEFIPTA